jgi:hypothetical protein
MKSLPPFLLSAVLFLIAASSCKKNQEPDYCQQWISPVNGATIQSGDSVLLKVTAPSVLGSQTANPDALVYIKNKDGTSIQILAFNNPRVYEGYDSTWIVLHAKANTIDTLNLSLLYPVVYAPYVLDTLLCPNNLTIYVQP